MHNGSLTEVAAPAADPLSSSPAEPDPLSSSVASSAAPQLVIPWWQPALPWRISVQRPPRSIAESEAEIQLRRADLDDLEAIFAIECAAFAADDGFEKQTLRSHIQLPTADFLVAEKSGLITGYCTVFHRRKSTKARLYNIALRIDQRGSGAAASLLDEASRLARLRGATLMYLEVRADNARAIRFYEKHGFREFGVIPEYYHDGTDAIRMGRPL
jgi:ribosomal-protein-alanine N-acetyltransferase